MAEKWGPGGALERSRAGYCAEAPGAPGVKKETRSEQSESIADAQCFDGTDHCDGKVAGIARDKDLAAALSGYRVEYFVIGIGESDQDGVRRNQNPVGDEPIDKLSDRCRWQAEFAAPQYLMIFSQDARVVGWQKMPGHRLTQ